MVYAVIELERLIENLKGDREMNFLEVKGNKRATFLNLDNLVKIDLLNDGQIQLTFVGTYFDIVEKGNKGYKELLELITPK